MFQMGKSGERVRKERKEGEAAAYLGGGGRKGREGKERRPASNGRGPPRKSKPRLKGLQPGAGGTRRSEILTRKRRLNPSLIRHFRRRRGGADLRVPRGGEGEEGKEMGGRTGRRGPDKSGTREAA